MSDKTGTPRTDRLFDEELGRMVASAPHFQYYMRVREEMIKLERELSAANEKAHSYYCQLSTARREAFEAVEDLRDTVLNERGAIAENGMTNDQVNDVLSEIDKCLAAIRALTGAGEGEK